MAYSLTVAGYTFENPPEEYRKLARLSNSPQTAFNRRSTAFYQSDSQDLQFQVEGTLALDPPLGETSDDLAELENLQDLAISGGEVQVEFDPFFTGKAVIEDDPFRQQAGESSYKFTFSVNTESTDSSSYPAHNSPDTGNTFELGSLDLGYDPKSVQQNYERQTEKVKRLQGIARTVDTEGLIPKVNISGLIDGGGQASLWDKARSNTLAYLSAEFQNGWALVDSVSIRNAPEAPDYLTGLFRYDLDLLIVMDPSSGIGETSKYVDQEVQGQTQYVSNCDEDGVFERLGDDTEDYPYALDYRVSGGTGKLNSEYIEWPEEFGTLDQSTTNYIWVEDGDGDGYGQVNTGTSGFPGNTVPLYEVDTGTSSVNDIRDMRSCLTGTRMDYDSLGDLNFQSDLAVSDQQFSFERLMALADSMAVTDPIERWRGLADLSDSLAVSEGPLEAQGITSLTDSVLVDDGGTALSGGTTEESQAYGGTTDFDNASAESKVVHAGFGDRAADTVQLGWTASESGLEAYFPMDDSSGPLEDATGNGYDASLSGTYSFGSTGMLESTAVDFPSLSSGKGISSGLGTAITDANSWTLDFWINYNQFNDYGVAIGQNSASFWIEPYRDGSGGVSANFSSGGTNQQINSGTVLSSTGTWYHCTWTYDGSVGKLYLDGTEIASKTFNATVDSFSDLVIAGYGNDSGNHVDAIFDEIRLYTRAISASEVSYLHETADPGTGSITLPWKSFGGDADASSLELQNVDSVLNNGSITAYLESDTDGDGIADETSDPISLDGSGGPYAVSGITTDNDRFRIQVDLDNSSIFDTPQFRSADLVGQVTGGSSSDSDQNPNTAWEIRGAEYDRSGNEYEGGGVVSKYGG